MGFTRSLTKVLITNFVLIGVLPFLLTSLLLYAFISRSITTVIEENLNVTSELVESLAHHYFEDASNYLRLMGSITPLDNNDFQSVTFRQNANKLFAQQTIYESIEWLDEQGLVVSILPYDETIIGLDRSNSLWFKEYIMDDTNPWSSTYYSIVSNQSTLTHMIKIKNGGYIVGNLNLDGIRHIGNQLPDEELDVTILDENGVYITSPDPIKASQRQYHPDYETIILSKDQLFRKKEDAQMRYFKIGTVTHTNWIILVSHSASAITRIRQLLITITLSLLLIVLIFAAIIIPASIKGILQPLVEMNQHFKKTIISGQPQKIEQVGYKEIGFFVSGFNTMIERLQSRDKKISQLAYEDSLTGLHNRYWIYDKVKQLTNDKSSPFALMRIDLDHFKAINDTLGYSIGDQILKKVAESFHRQQDAHHYFSRFGGDEFGIILCEQAGHSVYDDANNFFNQLITSFTFKDLKIEFTFSGGVVLFPSQKQDPEDLFTSLELSVAFAKKQGRKQLCLYQHQFSEYLTYQRALEEDLRKTNAMNCFFLDYQPLFYTDTLTIRGVEALIRWKRGEEIISPGLFLPLLEEMGKMYEVGKWVLEEAVSTLKRWETEFGFDGVMAVNISPLQMLNNLFVPDVLHIMHQFDVQKGTLELEITENILMNNLDNTSIILTELHENGILISLDDFGMEYSSLNYLNALTIDTLKIDRDFITDIEDEKKSIILNAMIDIGQKLGIDIVAEGVEYEQQLDYLRKRNCTMLQGFYLSRPISAKVFEEKWLTKKYT